MVQKSKNKLQSMEAVTGLESRVQGYEEAYHGLINFPSPAPPLHK